MAETTNQIKLIQVSDSFGNLVNAVNEVIVALSNSSDTVGELSELKTIDKTNIVDAVNEILTTLNTATGPLTGLEGKNITEHLAYLKRYIGDLKVYDILEGTTLVQVLDELVVVMEESSGEYGSLKERLKRIDEAVNRKSGEQMVSVADFDVVSSSTADQTEEILNALNHSIAMGARTLYFPPGTYRFRPITIQESNLVIRGSGRRTVLKSATSNAPALIRIVGSVESYDLAVDMVIGDKKVTPSTPNITAFKPGDDVQLEGSRNLARLPGTEFTIGDETERIKDYLYSEFNTVAESENNSASFTLTSGIQSRTVVNGERHLGSREKALVKRVNFRTGIWIRDLAFDGSDGSGFLSMEYASHSKVSDVHSDLTGSAQAVTLTHCKSVTLESLSIQYAAADDNACGIEIIAGEGCRVLNPMIQDSGIGVCIRSIERGVIARNHLVQNGHITNAQTVAIYEEATHATVVNNNTLTGFLTTGVFTTGRSTRVTGNTIKATRAKEVDESYYAMDLEHGVMIFGKGSQNGIVENNLIEGCRIAIRETNPPKHPKDYSGYLHTGNTIVDCWRGIHIQRPTTKGDEGISGVNNNFFSTKVIANNFQVVQSGQIPIFINDYANGLHFSGNSFQGENVAQYHSWFAGYCDYITYVNNSAIGFTSENPIYIATRFISGGSGSHEPMNALFENNTGAMDLSNFLGRIKREYIPRNHTLAPSNDNWFDLGTNSYRWRDVYLRNSPTVTSDRNEKEEIEPEELGLDFLKKLIPVSYRLIENQSNRRHHGLIAQDVEKALEDLGVGTDDHGALVIDEEGRYALRYEELISSLILGVQELNSRVDSLEKRLK